MSHIKESCDILASKEHFRKLEIKIENCFYKAGMQLEKLGELSKKLENGFCNINSCSDFADGYEFSDFIRLNNDSMPDFGMDDEFQKKYVDFYENLALWKYYVDSFKIIAKKIDFELEDWEQMKGS